MHQQAIRRLGTGCLLHHGQGLPSATICTLRHNNTTQQTQERATNQKTVKETNYLKSPSRNHNSRDAQGSNPRPHPHPNRSKPQDVIQRGVPIYAYHTHLVRKTPHRPPHRETHVSSNRNISRPKTPATSPRITQPRRDRASAVLYKKTLPQRSRTRKASS